jgi:integrase
MSDLRRKDSGNWEARYRFRDARTGNILRRGKTFTTRREAEHWLARKSVELQDGELVDPRKAERPFSEAVALWQARWPQRIQPKTEARYQSVLDTHLTKAFGNRSLASIDRHVIQHYIDSLPQATKKRKAQSPASIQKIYACLRAIFNAAVRAGWLRQSPCQQIELPRIPHTEMLYLTGPEVSALAAAINPRYRAMVYLAGYTGLRAGELGGLRIGRLNLLKNQLTVEETLVDAGGGLQFGDPKTQRSRRTVSIPPFLKDMLALHLKNYGPDLPDSTALVFTTVRGTPVRHSNFYREHFQPAVLRALPHKPGFRFHDLRHTCAGLLIAQGAHPKVIQERLGHASIAITMDRYGHLLPALDEAVVTGLEATYHAAQRPAKVKVAALKG